MPDYSLVPVEHQPDFEEASLVPVDHDPFSDSGAVQQAQLQPVQPQTQQAPLQPEDPTQSPGTAIAQPGVGAQAVEPGESWDPDAESDDGHTSDQPTHSSTAPIVSPDNAASKPFGELKPATYTPTQQIGNFAADALMGLGMKPYFANDLTSRVGNLLGLTPLGVVGSALDLIDAKRRDDLPGVLTAAAGMIPGAKGVARGVAAEAIERHHPWSKYLGGPVKQELVALPKSLHQKFHAGLDAELPRRKGTAYYQSRNPIERQQDLQYLAKYTKEFDAEHGTKIYDALLRNGFPAL
jgi:hypothetical protein